MSLTRACLAAPLACLLFSTGAGADLTLTGRSTLTAMNMPSSSQERIYLKKAFLRRDQLDRGKAYTYIYDLRGHDITMLDHSQRLVQTYEMTAPVNTPEAKAAQKDLKLDLEATGQKHALGNWSCAEHTVVATMPAELGPEKVVMQLSGKVWLAHGTREQKELQPFFKAMDSPDFMLGIPALSKSSPAQARVVSEVLRRLFSHGMICAFDVDMRYEGGGRMAELARRMATRVALTYDNATNDPIPDAFFVVPQGYQPSTRR